MSETIVDHICQCRHCTPDLFPSGPPVNPGHFAVRFGHTGGRLQPFLNDVPEMKATEILCGSPGFVYVFTAPVHRCSCGEGVCEEVKIGETRVEGELLMPFKASSSCSVPGCPGRAAHRGRCPEHAEQLSRTHEIERGTSTDRGYGSTWRKRRDAYLREHPFCVDCWKLGREQYATEVDHIVPKSQGGADEESNYQPLCHEHHSAKTMREINRRR